eukprot:CAMPEP_0194304274 /NCGR_PEP_ID=MMETSP0171-20130528/2052_1 /TAXON_ID=218684 /ORGANISM="Corethron pennatum, Strain L29A3" /LENGTH=553 /DNA_ID=CAMNT_0039055493 /DNA_START=111 /DNA_END=1772 /DNA_ORIENTATION=-
MKQISRRQCCCYLAALSLVPSPGYAYSLQESAIAPPRPLSPTAAADIRGTHELLERARALHKTRSRRRLDRQSGGGDLVSRILQASGTVEKTHPERFRADAPVYDQDSLYGNLFGDGCSAPLPLFEEVVLGDDDDPMDSVVARQEISTLLAASEGDVEATVLQKEAQRRRAPAAAEKEEYIEAQRASEGEKEAMSRTSAQLPRAVSKNDIPSAPVAAAPSQEAPVRSTEEVLAGSGRVTPAEEVLLSRLIRRGAELVRIKETMERELGRPPTRAEWATAADASSAALRRDVSRYATAKNRLVTANLGLVHAVVKHGMGRKDGGKRALTYRGVTQDELLQEGTLGLIRAAELFDPERGLRFSTYATIWIKGAIGNHRLDQFITLPTKWRSKAARIERCRAAAVAEGGGVPTVATLAALTDLPEKDVRNISTKMDQARNVLSIDHEYANRSGSGDGVTFRGLSDKFVDNDAAAEVVALKADIVGVLASALTEREGRLIRLRYGLNDGGQGRSLQQCATAMGISYRRAREISVTCIEKLRNAENAGALQEYLLTVA